MINQSKADEFILTLTAYDAHQITGLRQLCDEWNVKPVIEYPDDGGRPYWNIPETIRLLAQHIKGE